MRILYLTHRLPYAPDRGDRIRAHHMLRALATSAEVHLFSLVHDDEERSRAAALRDLTASVTLAQVPRMRNLVKGAVRLGSSRPLTHSLLDAPAVERALATISAEKRPDVVLAYCSGMARFAGRHPLADVAFVMDLVDVDSEKWADYARTTRGPMGWIYAREARCLAPFEETAARAAHATLVVNDRERSALASRVPDADVRVVPNGIDLEAFRPAGPPASAPRVVFCGVLDYRPNERGAIWFATKVWPLIRAKRPDARLTLVGRNPTPAVRALTDSDRSIDVTGAVPDVRPYLWDAAVGIAPLFEARGVQNKVLEAVAAGIPMVVTPAVDLGLPSQVRRACLVASDVDAYASSVLSLLELMPAGRRRLATCADLAQLGWRECLSDLLPILQEAVSVRRLKRAEVI
jgi:sugar transferase (PEP-CTERM/EpsH1 system associated)